MYKKILLSMDSSEDAERAAQKAIEIKKQWNSEVIAFHSIEHHLTPQQLPLSSPVGSTYEYIIPPDTYDKIEQAYKDHGKQILQKVENMFQEEGLKVETRLITFNDPEDYIIETVKKENFDLVILGCKGAHSKLKEIFIGSVAQTVLNRAPCDILVIR